MATPKKRPAASAPSATVAPLTPPKPPARKSNGAGPRKVSRAEAEKAIADMRDKPRKGKFRTVEFDLPSKLPAAFVFDVGEMQSGDGTDFGVVHRLMVGVVGPVAWRSMRDVIAADGDAMDDLHILMDELFDAVMAPYGMTPGESEASSDS